ncbi:MAG: SBBP repeat-containing protein [Candidatus Eisenbacteria bacterium]
MQPLHVLWIVLHLAAASLHATAARAQLAFGLGSSSGDVGRAIAVDASGNFHITGYFNGVVDFDPGPGVFELSAGNDEAVFVASYSPTGTLRWALSFPGEGNGIAVDGDGNVFVTGEIRGAEVDVDPSPEELLLYPQEGRVFLVSYDSSGSLRFGFNFGGGIVNRVEFGSALAVDEVGDVYLTGVINDDTDFDGPFGDPPVVMNGVTDGFVASYSGQGAYRFGVGIGGTLADAGYGIATLAGGGCYVTGAFRGTVDFDPDPGIANERTSEGNLDIFVASYTSTGGLSQVVAAGGPFDDIARAVTADAAGNVFVTGEFRDTVDFDPDPDEALVTSAGNRDFFLASYTEVAAFRFAFGLGTSNDMRGLGVTLDDEGNPWVTGEFTGTVDFDPGPADASIGGTFDVFVASYAGTGEFRHAYHYPDTGSGDSDIGEGIALDGAAQTYVVGSFRGTNDFDPGPANLELTSSGNQDVFVVRDQAPASGVDPQPAGTLDAAFGRAVPNPSNGRLRFEYRAQRSGQVRATLYDGSGRLVATLFHGRLDAGEREAFDLTGLRLPSGRYYVRVRDGFWSDGRELRDRSLIRALGHACHCESGPINRT